GEIPRAALVLEARGQEPHRGRPQIRARRQAGRATLTRCHFGGTLEPPPPTRGSYDRSCARREGSAARRDRRSSRERDRVVRLLHLRQLAALLSVKFFAAGASGSALIKTVGTFTAGFLIRPFGAFVFGRIGDLVGRKYTFLVTLSGMGLSTALIGFVPSYAQIGAAAGILLLILRLIQGLCLGGEYGGAITYVAEHAPDEKRGYYTGWLQTSPTLGIVVSLAVIVVTREVLGTEAFTAWGWRIPFILSLLMVAIAIYIRLRLQETPIFQAIKAKGQISTSPWREAFLS